MSNTCNWYECGTQHNIYIIRYSEIRDNKIPTPAPPTLLDTDVKLLDAIRDIKIG